MTKLRIEGHELSTSAQTDEGLAIEGIVESRRVRTTATTRGETSLIELDLDDDAVLEVQCERGWTEIMTVAQARERSGVSRDDGEGGFELPAALGGAVGRGALPQTIEQVRVFDVAALIDRLEGQLTDLSAEGIAYLVEKELWNKKKRSAGLGLMQVGDARDRFEFAPYPEGKAANGERHLLLIHGTFSNASDAFSGFVGTTEWAQLIDQYHGRVLAFEHKTLGESPIDNALTLAKALPKGATFDMVSHSRGGLVGDLLNMKRVSDERLGQFVKMRAKRKPQISLAQLLREPAEQFVLGEVEKLRALDDVLRERAITVGRFVRAASPSRGTVLASRRLDRVLQVVLNLIGLLPGLAANPIFSFVKSLALATAGKRSDPQVLPGLEAMMPSSPLIWLLNGQPVRKKDQLAIVAGDITGGGIFGTLKIAAIDAMYGCRDHDLVVNTSAMMQGLLRDEALVSFQRGPDVSHSAYFRNEVTRARIRNFLRGQEPVPKGFSQLPPDRGIIEPDNVSRGLPLQPSKPALLLLGGQFGSVVGGNSDTLWPSPESLAAGRLPELAQAEEARALSGEAYEAAVRRFGEDFNLVHVPYDLRKSPAEAAQVLQEKLAAALQECPRGASILAHSGGGLAVAAWIAADRQRVQRLLDTGGRIVLAGPPLYGSHEAQRWIHGEGTLVEQIELLDPERSSQEIGAILAGLPGIAALLPDAPPSENKTDDGALRPSLDTTLLSGVHVVIGSGVDTVAGVSPIGQAELEPGARSNKLPWLVSTQGDGFVLQRAASELAGACSWIARVDHLGLVNDGDTLDGLSELLRSGSTERFAVGQSRVEHGATLRRQEPPALFPSSKTLVWSGLGRALEPPNPTEEEAALEIEVCNASLHTIVLPVMVGHYEGSPIAGAEAFFDRRMSGALSDHDYFGRYPQQVGEARLVHASDGPDALVLGLGAAGTLTANGLSQSVAAAAVEYALLRAERDEAVVDKATEIASLLIGTVGRQGLPIMVATAAIVRGVVQANRQLHRRGLDRVRIDKLVIVERYADLAEQAAQAVRTIETLLGGEADGLRIRPAPFLREGEGARPGSPAMDYEQGAWQPLFIRRPASTQDYAAQAGAPDAAYELEFVSLGRRASADAEKPVVVTAQTRALIRSAVSTKAFGQINNTLYELLLPPDLKHELRSAGNLQLMLDEKAAMIPWELLATRDLQNGGGAAVPEPLAERVGILRRLSLPRDHTMRRGPMGCRALLIGDPYAGTGYPRLRGARDEVREVAGRLSEGSYELLLLSPRDDDEHLHWEQIENALFERDWRIIHIAAHGNFDPLRPHESGVLIGEKRYLDASLVRQLPVVPELVFLNCCHLARLGPDDEEAEALKTTRAHLNEFAASIAVELMRIGVRAVVAAGWAVDDEGARRFANTFYARMLGGFAFGEAVKQARGAVLSHEKQSGRRSNTWAAYQCYGDPGFRLTLGEQSRADSSIPISREALRCVLDNLCEDIAETRDSHHFRSIGDRLQQLARSVPPQWLSGPEGSVVRARLGKAHADLADFGGAVRHYREAIQGQPEQWPAGLLDQLLNAEVRRARALRLGEAESSGPGDTVHELLESATAHLSILDRLAKSLGRHHAQSEMAGSYHKKRAVTLSDPQQRDDAMRKALKAYGSRARRADGSIDVYPALNHLQFAALLGVHGGAQKRLLKDCVEAVKNLTANPTSFWDRVAAADFELTVAMVDGTLQEERRAEIEEAYRLALETRSSVRERASVSEHLRDLEELSKDRTTQEALGQLRRAVSRFGAAELSADAGDRPSDDDTGTPPASPPPPPPPR